MILSSILAIGILASGVAADVHPLMPVFVSACLDGKAALPAGSARQIRFKDLPAAVRVYGNSPDATFYEITSPTRGYLMVSKNLKGAYSEVCALAAPDLQFRAAYEQVVNLISLHRPQETVGRRTLMLEYYDARQGIIIGARSLKAGWGFVKVARPNGPYKGIFGNTPGLPVKRSDKPKDNLPKQDQ